ncbi:MAG TPA: flagellar hook-length control protein FliK [Caulobacterales bacterium]|nr:flagellar hook-length control protein FliK [Caulobacterales bacterium]
MAFQLAAINASESLLAPPAVTPNAAGGEDKSGLFQMLLAGAAAQGGDTPVLQAVANPAPSIAPANSGGAVAMLLQTADAPTQAAPNIADAAQSTFAPAEPQTIAPTAEKQPAGAAQLKPAVLAAGDAPPVAQAEAPTSQQTSSAPTAIILAVATAGDDAGDQAAAPAPQQAAMVSPDAAQAIVFAPFTTQNAAPAAKPGQAAAGEVIETDQPSAPQKSEFFKKAVFAATPTKANAAGASVVARAIATEAAATPQGQQQRADSAQPGSTSPIAGFEAPRAASDALSTPVARAPHGAAAMQIAQSITRNFNGKSANFEVRLDPAELGRVDVKISVDHDKRVTASVSADNPQTLTDLRGAARDIERALNEAGLDLAQDGLSFDLNQRQANDDQFDGSPYAAAQDEASGETALLGAAPFGMQRWSNSGVDVWA